MKIQDIFSSIRSNLTQIIKNWERSGQGDGGADETTSEAERGNDEENCADAYERAFSGVFKEDQLVHLTLGQHSSTASHHIYCISGR